MAGSIVFEQSVIPTTTVAEEYASQKIVIRMDTRDRTLIILEGTHYGQYFGILPANLDRFIAALQEFRGATAL